MTTTTKQFMADQHVTPARKLENVTDLTDVLAPGDYLAEYLVTDTIVFEVVKVTPKTVTLRETKYSGEVYVDEKQDVGAYGFTVNWRACEPDTTARTFTRRLNKNGQVMAGNHAHAAAYRIPNMVNGKPVARIDWRF